MQRSGSFSLKYDQWLSGSVQVLPASILLVQVLLSYPHFQPTPSPIHSDDSVANTRAIHFHSSQSERFMCSGPSPARHSSVRVCFCQITQPSHINQHRSDHPPYLSNELDFVVKSTQIGAGVPSVKTPLFTVYPGLGQTL